MNLRLWIVIALSLGSPASFAIAAGMKLSVNSSRGSSNEAHRPYRDKTTPEEFIRDNYEEFKQEAAKGEGDYLEIATNMLVEDADDKKRFVKALKKNHRKLLTSNEEKSARRVVKFAKKYD